MSIVKNFLKKRPALEDGCDTVLSLPSGSFALLAMGFAWARRLARRARDRKN